MKVLSLAELSSGIKLLLETTFEYIKVKGEAIQCKRYPSGHLYFTLKDNTNTIDCVCWQSVKLSFEPQDGIEIICTGKVTSYPGRSKYQLNIANIEHSGLGAILKAIEERRQKLAKEGIFDADKKLPIPKYISKLGIITSPKGAVIHDMLHRLRDRYPVPVVLYPIPVQGPEVPQAAIRAIQYFQENPVDVIILARGGGSFEDLIGFHDEALVRAVANSKIPIVTAIGHETDTTLVDYASALRAPTPTASIELITQDRKQAIGALDELDNAMSGALTRLIKYNLSILKAVRLAKGTVFEINAQRYDYASGRLQNFIQHHIGRDLIMLRLTKPDMSHANRALLSLTDKCAQISRNEVRHAESRFTQAEQLLKVVSYKNTLKRGFCRAYSSSTGISHAGQAVEAGEFTLEFSDGAVKVLGCTEVKTKSKVS